KYSTIEFEKKQYISVDGCYLTYDFNQFIWMFSETKACDIFQKYVDFGVLVSVSSVILVLDSATFVILRKKYKLSTFHTPKAKRHNEIMFYVQSVSQMLLYVFCYFFYCILSRYATNGWTLFLYTTVSWSIMHSVEGVIITVFNIRLIFRLRSSAVKE
ncbi:hypothetical protein PMAYCL1PPCAC_15030, partial [Pristionchus mayeri]